AFVVMGTTAAREPAAFTSCVEANPGRVLAAVDIKQGRPAVSGWTATEALEVEALVSRWNPLPLAAVTVTCVDRDGTMEGPDLETLARVRAASAHPVIYGGGVGSLEDLQALVAAEAAGVIVGKAIYEGRLDLRAALELSA